MSTIQTVTHKLNLVRAEIQHVQLELLHSHTVTEMLDCHTIVKMEN